MNTPHYDKLTATLENEKLPPEEKHRIEEAIEKYQVWIKALGDAKKNGSPEEIVKAMVDLLNGYKLYIEFDLIFNSRNDFLHRQKGQLKLDNSIIEEFLPHLIIPEIIPELKEIHIDVGNSNTFSSIYFTSNLGSFSKGGGLNIRTKDQDFAITKRLFIRSSFNPDFSNEITESTNICYVAAECKTNLDKTMFQEATATAHDLKTSVPGAKYFLLCEWLDMTPISTAPTDIDEVLILRKAKRISSNKRSGFSTFKGRQENKDFYKDYLQTHPFQFEMIMRLIGHIQKLITKESLIEKDVLNEGFF